MTVAWSRDLPTENGLRQLGVPWAEEQVLLSQIDREEGLRRQVRLIGKLNDDVVLQYAIAMEAPGAKFPMVLLQKFGKGRYFPWGGNHRLAALDIVTPPELRDQTLVGAYVVDIKDARLIDILPRVLNLWVGQGLSREERVVNAQFLVEKHGMPAADAARIFGLRVENIYVARRVEDTKRKLAALGVAAGRFPRTLLGELAKIENSNVLKKTASFIHENKVKGLEAMAVVHDVRQKDTEAQAIGEIGRWERVIADRNKPRRSVEVPYRQPNRANFLRYLTSLSKFLQGHKTLQQAQIVDPADVAVVRQKARQIVVDLHQMLEIREAV